MICTIYVVKTKALISYAVTGQLICASFLHMQKAGFLLMQLIGLIWSETFTAVAKSVNK